MAPLTKQFVTQLGELRVFAAQAVADGAPTDMNQLMALYRCDSKRKLRRTMRRQQAAAEQIKKARAAGAGI